MGNNRKVYGELTVRPPLTWAQIRAYQGEGGLVRDSLRFMVNQFTQETDEGSFVQKSCRLIEPASWENAYGVVGALGVLAKVAPDNEFIGDITIVTENPLFDENAPVSDAQRYSISEGKLYASTPQINWGPFEEVK